MNQFIKAHSLTYQDLCDRLGYRSKTSITRIVKEKTSYVLRCRFYQNLLTGYALTATERRAFEQALEASRTSDAEKDAVSSISALFSGYGSASMPPLECCVFDGSEKPITLKKLLDDCLATAQNPRALLFGLHASPHLNALTAQLTQRGIATTHLLPQNMSTPDMYRYLASVRSTLFKDNYAPSLYLSRKSEVRLENLAFLQYEQLDGSLNTLLLFPDVGNRLIFIVIPGLDVYELCAHCIAQSSRQPLKKLFTGEATETAEKDASLFIAKQQFCCKLEANHYALCFVGDFPLECIAPEHFKKALLLPLSSGVAQKLISLQEKRSIYPVLPNSGPRSRTNVHSRVMPRFIFPKMALDHFFETGRLLNHPSFLRTFTSTERKFIMDSFLTTLRQGPICPVRLYESEKTLLARFFRIQCFYFPPKASARQSNRQDTLLITPAGSASTAHAAYVALREPDMVDRFVQYYNSELWPNATPPDKALYTFP